MSALNPYAVTPEPRTDSKPFRRCLVQKTGFGSCRRKLLQKYFRQSFESQVAGRSRLLETWSPCSRPFAILPVSAVSDAQKLATGNFLHVRAALSLLLSQQFLPLRGFLRRLAAASFGGKAAKSRAPNGARLFLPPGYSRLSAELRRIFRVLVLSNSR